MRLKALIIELKESNTELLEGMIENLENESLKKELLFLKENILSPRDEYIDDIIQKASYFLDFDVPRQLENQIKRDLLADFQSMFRFYSQKELIITSNKMTDGGL